MSEERVKDVDKGKKEEPKSVAERMGPKLKDVLGGPSGKLMIETLQAVSEETQGVAGSVKEELGREIQSLRLDAAAATGAARRAEEKADQATTAANLATETVAGMENTAEALGTRVDELSSAVGEKAAQSTVEELGTRVGKVEEKVGALDGQAQSNTEAVAGLDEMVRTVQEAVAECTSALTRKVGENGEKVEKKGKDLVSHLFDQLQRLEDALSTYGDKAGRAMNIAMEAQTAAEHAEELIDTAREQVEVANASGREEEERQASRISDVEEAVEEVRRASLAPPPPPQSEGSEEELGAKIKALVEGELAAQLGKLVEDAIGPLREKVTAIERTLAEKTVPDNVATVDVVDQKVEEAVGELTEDLDKELDERLAGLGASAQLPDNVATVDVVDQKVGDALDGFAEDLDAELNPVKEQLERQKELLELIAGKEAEGARMLADLREETTKESLVLALLDGDQDDLKEVVDMGGQETAQKILREFVEDPEIVKAVLEQVVDPTELDESVRTVVEKVRGITGAGA